jgi:putative thioredoxin
MAAKSPWIVETTEATFQDDVVERSRKVPVVIDFWAPWCQPCRLLGPLLERLADEHQGKFVLVKANTEEIPEMAAAFGVESIPAVYALRDGALVDQFVGLMPEQQLRDWLAGILPTPAEQLLDEARTLEVADPAASESKYREAVRLAPNHVAAQTGLARVLLHRGALDESRRILEELAAAASLDREGEQVLAEIKLREQGQQAGSVEQTRAAAEANPDDLPKQLDFARALAAAGRYEEALEAAIVLAQRDRRSMGEAVREFMVSLFHLLGPDSELASNYRRKLALALY